MSTGEDFGRAEFAGLSERTEPFGLGSDVLVIETGRSSALGDVGGLGVNAVGVSDKPSLSVDTTVRQATR